jgi:hypothetical protein
VDSVVSLERIKMHLPTAVIIDLNGCLGDCTHRDFFLQKKPREWGNFFKHMMNDKPVDLVHRFCNAQKEHPFFSKVIIITGSPESYKDECMIWLRENQVEFDELIMRPNGNFKKGKDWKKEVVQNDLKLRYDVVLALDDKEECAEMYCSIGVPCWLVHNSVGPSKQGGKTDRMIQQEAIRARRPGR